MFSRCGLRMSTNMIYSGWMSQLDTYEEYEVPWDKNDLFFLLDAVERGMSYGRIAGFLGRSEAEVREKSPGVEIKRPKRKQLA
jgi:hypothetical protein